MVLWKIIVHASPMILWTRPLIAGMFSKIPAGDKDLVNTCWRCWSVVSCCDEMPTAVCLMVEGWLWLAAVMVGSLAWLLEWPCWWDPRQLSER